MNSRFEDSRTVGGRGFGFFRPLPIPQGVLSETHIRYQLGDMLITNG